MLDEDIELDEEEELDEVDEVDEEEFDEIDEVDEEELDEVDEVDEEEFDEEPKEHEKEKIKKSVKPQERQENLRKQLEMIPAKGTNFCLASRFYYEERNYDEAIKMYQAAIAEESDELIVAKSLYYMAESYIKLKKLSEAISVFEDLAGRLPGHYLTANAKRRIDVLKEDVNYPD